MWPNGTPVIQTWILNADHSIQTWYESTPNIVAYRALCKCGWRSSSASAGLRNWNVDGHAKDVWAGREHDPQLCGQCTEEEYR